MVFLTGLGSYGLAAEPPTPNVHAQVAFTPHEQADAVLLEVIASARRAIQVQAYSFTFRKFAVALVQARRRGIDVTVIVDREQSARPPGSVIGEMVAAGIPVYLDGQHDAAHNKVMVIDAGEADCAVVTGSYNFSFAAQHRNAENLLVLRGSRELCERFRRNWDLHRAHALPYRR